MKEITIKLTDKEYQQYVRKGQSEYRIRMKKAIEDEDYVNGCLCSENIIEVNVPKIC